MNARPWFEWALLWAVLIGVWTSVSVWTPTPPWWNEKAVLVPLIPKALKPISPQRNGPIQPAGSLETLSLPNRPELAFLDSLPDDLPSSWKLDGSTSAWFALRRFFQRLPHAQHDLLEVYHWGDSQIEADRISGPLRASWQQRWGGRGPGWVLPNTPAQTTATLEEITGSIVRRAGFGGRSDDEALRLPFFAVNEVVGKAEWRVQGATKSSASLGDWGWSEVHTAAPTGSIQLRTATSDWRPSEGKNDSLHAWHHPDSGSRVWLRFHDVTVAGVHLGSPKGVLVHNLPLRGSAGTLFDKVTEEDWTSMRANHPPALILLQFGGNAVPGIRSPSGARWYAERMAHNVKLLRLQFPGVPVVFVGPSDMGASDQDYPSLPWVVDALRESVLNAGGLYWDLREVMGGAGSMASWVDRGWASSDHIHFTRRGASEVAQRLEAALNHEWKAMRP